jgi:hypothetical protein
MHCSWWCRQPQRSSLRRRGTTVGRSGRPVHTDPSPTDWRFLHRGNDRDILQHNHRAEHEWLRVAQSVHIEQWGRIICIERRRWCHQSVDPTLLKRTAVQRCATDQAACATRLLTRLPMTSTRARGRLSGGLFILLAGDREQHLALSLNPLLALFRLGSRCT